MALDPITINPPTKILTSVCRFVFVAAILFQFETIAFAQNNSEEQVISNLSYEIGKVVDPKTSPALHKALTRTFDRLTIAQKNISQSKNIITNELLLLDAPARIMATVKTVQQPGIPGVHNIAAVSTGMLQSLFKPMAEESSADAIKRGLTLFAGIMARELARPLHILDDRLDKNWLESSAEQAIIIRTDNDALEILKQAGYPSDSLYRALELLYDHEEQKQANPLVDSIRGKPENTMRLTAQRLALTLDRMENGQTELANSETAPPLIVKELAQLIAANPAGKFYAEKTFEVPKTLEDAFNRIETALRSYDHRNDSGDQLSEINRLILSIDVLLMQKGQNFSESDINRLFQMNRQIAEKVHIFTWRDIDELNFHSRIRKDDPIFKQTDGRVHEDLVPLIPIYKAPDYRQLVENEFATKSGDEALRELKNFVSTGDAYQMLAQSMTDSLKTVPNADRNSGKSYPSFMSTLSTRDRIHVAQIFHEKVFDQISIVDKMILFSSQSEKRPTFDYTFFQIYMDPAANKTEFGKTPDEIEEILTKPEFAAEAASLKAIAQNIWKKRSEYVWYEFVMPENVKMDWNLIFRLNGLNNEEGSQRLNQALKETSQSEHFLEILKSFHRFSIMDPKTSKIPMDWAASDLRPYLLGDKNTFIGADKREIVRNIATKSFLKRFYISQPNVFRNDFKVMFTKAIESLSTTDIDEPYENTINKLIGVNANFTEHAYNVPTTSNLPVNVDDVVAMVIWESHLPHEQKLEMLKKRFLISERNHDLDKHHNNVTRPLGDFGEHWVLQSGQHQNIRIINVLYQAGLIKSGRDLFAMIRPGSYDGIHFQDVNIYARAVEAYTIGLDDELKKIDQITEPKRRIQELIGFTKIYVNLWDQFSVHQDKTLLNSRFRRELKDKVVQVALRSSNINMEQGLDLFYLLTNTGPNAQTDQFLKTIIDKYFVTLTADSYRHLQRILKEKRIDSQNLELSLTQQLVSAQTPSLKQKQISDKEAKTLMTRINTLAPRNSMAKDEMLEQLTYDLDIQDESILKFIEAHKSTNWRRASPYMLNWASFFAGNLKDLSPEEILVIINYMRDPGNKDFPDFLSPAFARSAREAILKTLAGKTISASEMDKKIDDAIIQAKKKFETMARDSSPMERIPIFDLLLNTGRKPLAKDPHFPANILENLLGLKHGSEHEIGMRSYLEIVPMHEKTVTLAYQLSMSSQDKAGVKGAFEAFSTAGIKSGQAASLFEIFSPAINEELAELKSNARAMTHLEITQRLQKFLGRKDFKVVKILGSASIKTVALVEFPDGRRIAAMLRRPNAVETVKATMQMAENFINQMRKNGLEIGEGILASFIKSLKQSLSEELDLREEVKKYVKAKELYANLEKDLAKQMVGANGERWKFNVPDVQNDLPMNEEFFATRWVQGQTFDKIRDSSVIQEVGPLMAQSAIMGLFRYGVFDADRHAGNHLVDEKTKTIHILDPGQLYEFSATRWMWQSDDRLSLAEFLLNVSQANTDELIKTALKMSETSKQPTDMAALARDVSAALSSSNLSTKLASLLRVLHNHRIEMRQEFSFGALKGLMTLYKEKYVSPVEFEKMVQAEVSRVLVYKSPIQAIKAWRKDNQSSNKRECSKVLIK